MFAKQLVGQYADENDTAKHREVQRRRQLQKINEILQHLNQRRAEHDSQYRSLATAQAASPQHGRGDAEKLVKVPVRCGRDGVGVKGKEHPRQRRQRGADDIRRSDHALGVDAAVAGCLFVSTHRVEIAAVHAAVQQNARGDGDDDQ